MLNLKTLTFAIVLTGLLGGAQVMAAPVDSQLGSGATTSGITPIRDASDTSLQAPTGKPFLLERGFSDVDKRAESKSDGSPGAYYPSGTACGTSFSTSLPQAQNYYGSGIHLAACKAALSTKKRCPKNFTPVVKVLPNSVAPSIASPIFACLSPLSRNPGDYNTGVYNLNSGYYAWYMTPATHDKDGTFIPFVSVQWEMYCYPNKKVHHTNTADSTRYAEDNIRPPALPHCEIANLNNAALPLLLWDTGVIDTTSTRADSAYKTASTHRHCPQGYQPYVSFGSASIAVNRDGLPMEDRHYAVGPSGVCVNSVYDKPGDPTKHEFRYLSKATTMRLDFDETGFALHEPVDAYRVRNLQWTLYCYPPGTPVPDSFPNYCTTSRWPFQ